MVKPWASIILAGIVSVAMSLPQETGSADQGNAKAQYALGHMYIKGLGVPQDNVQAHMWLWPAPINNTTF